MIRLLQKKGELRAELPPGWNLKQTLFKEGSDETGSTRDLMKGAMERPIGSPPLGELLKPDFRVAVIIDDLTRSTPVGDLLPGLLEVIASRGIPPEHVEIVIGVGTHRPMSPDEVETRVGREISRTYRILNHDARSPDLVVMGEVPEYGKISFNRTVVEADVKITVGSILPHVHNGYGGGAKNIMPGVCDFDTIRKHHLKHVLHPLSRVGIVEGNPFLRDTVEIARLARIDFAVQCLRDSFGRICEVLAGELFAVQEEGMRRQGERLGVPVSDKTEVTIVSSFPYDEGVQIMKAFLPSAMVTQPGGSLFVVAELKEPLPDFFIESIRRVRGDGDCVVNPESAAKLSRCEPLIEGVAMDFNMAIILVVAVANRFNLTLVGGPALDSLADAMGCKRSPDLTTAMESRGLEQASVSLIPAGGYIFPIISEPFHLI
jgi:lactate racemase